MRHPPVPDYYEILRLEQNASIRAVRKAYKRLAILHHPDKGGNLAVMQQINEAYSILVDAKLRASYDIEHPYVRRAWERYRRGKAYSEYDTDSEIDICLGENGDLNDIFACNDESDDSQYGPTTDDFARALGEEEFVVQLGDGTWEGERRHDCVDPKHETCVLDDYGSHVSKRVVEKNQSGHL